MKMPIIEKAISLLFIITLLVLGLISYAMVTL